MKLYIGVKNIFAIIFDSFQSGDVAVLKTDLKYI